MIQRIALLAGGLGAAIVLAVALGAANLITFGAVGPAATPDSALADVGVTADAGTTAATVAADTNATAQPQTKTVVDKVYIAPSHPPKVVHVTRTAPTAPPTRAPSATNASSPHAPAAA